MSRVAPFSLAVFLALGTHACGPLADRATGPELELVGAPQVSGTDALLQAVSPVSPDVVWVSGHDATWLRTTDGGATWSAGVMTGAEELQFRDVAAFDANTAYLMSSGTGGLSRIYRTDDGGATWTLQHTATHPEAFLDCMDFWDQDQGLVYGDEVDGVPFILRTEDGGDTWTRVDPDGLPAAQDGEGGFAASGTCLVTGVPGRAWIATGNAERARVLATLDGGHTWSVAEVPVAAGTGAGLTTLQMARYGRGIALGGVIGADTVWTDNVVVTTDSGVTWTLAGRPAMSGPVYGSAWVETDAGPVVVAVGPGGMDWSGDGGQSWRSADTLTYWAVAFADGETGWAVGPDGRITKLSIGIR
ncbi:MAG: oxidoreductase [Gemmatimonadota bacterium]